MKPESQLYQLRLCDSSGSCITAVISASDTHSTGEPRNHGRRRQRGWTRIKLLSQDHVRPSLAERRRYTILLARCRQHAFAIAVVNGSRDMISKYMYV